MNSAPEERRYVRQMRFLAHRFDPATTLGLALTGSVAAVALLGASLVTITEDVLGRDDLVRADSPISRFFLEHRAAWLTTCMEVATQLGSAVVLAPVLLALGLLARRIQGTWGPLVFLAVALAGASTISALVKWLVARPRPPTGALVEAFGYAFPSGHSTAAAAGWLAAVLVAGSLCRTVALRISLLVSALLVIVLVGVSRVYLGVHTATDVLGGWAVGGLWVALVLSATQVLAARHDDEGR